MRMPESVGGIGDAFSTPSRPTVPIAPTSHDRMRSVLRASLVASLAVTMSCADSPTAPMSKQDSATTWLSSASDAAVSTVLGDVLVRIDDGIEDPAVRTSFASVLQRMKANVSDGRLDEARQDMVEAHAALARAAELDVDGSGDADRSAIALAFDFADQEVTNARLGAAGGVK